MIDQKATERAFFGCVLANPETALPIAMAAGVRTDWFTEDPWPAVWRACERIWERGQVSGADANAIFEEARRVAADPKTATPAANLTAATLCDAMDATIISDPTVHVADLRSARIERKTRWALAKRTKEFASSDARTVTIGLRSDIDDILGETTSEKKISPARVYEGIMAEYELAHRMRVAADGPRNLNWTPGIKMPWPELTRMLQGLRPGLHVIAARPSVGKTSYAVNLMRFWCETGVKVVFDSLDMPRAEAMRRFLTERSRVSIRKAAFSPTQEDLARMRAAKAELEKWPLALVEIEDVEELRTFCMIERAAERLDVLVVDYLGLLTSRKVNNGIEYERVSHVSNMLKKLANELNIPVIALCQLNREITKKEGDAREPGLSDLRGSGSIEQDAFTVTLLHREEKVVNEAWKERQPVWLMPDYSPNGVEALDSVWWILCKAQNGGTGKLPFVVRKNYFVWSLGDYTAQPDEQETGYGATKRVTKDWSPLFSRVYADWRRDPIEEKLEGQRVLLHSRIDSDE